MISVVIPTVPGREEVFERVRASFERFGAGDHELEVVVEYDHPAVGCAWQAGAEKARGDYILMGNDDCEPLPGWWIPAIEAVDAGCIPSPAVRDTGGHLQSLPDWGCLAEDWTEVSCCLIPFMSRSQWEAIQPLFLGHYYADNFITERARASGWRCVLRCGFGFVHHWAGARRGAGKESQRAREFFDEPNFYKALEKVSKGQWTEPWPPGGGQ